MKRRRNIGVAATVVLAAGALVMGQMRTSSGASGGRAADSKPGPTANSAGQVSIKVVGLAVSLPAGQDKPGLSMAMGLRPGTHVYLAMTAADKYLTRFDDQASKLLSFMDDKGTNLTGQPIVGNFGFPVTSADQHQCVVEVISDKLPAVGARTVKIKANVMLLAGADLKNQTVPAIELKQRTKLALGPLPVEIENTQEQDWGDQRSFVVTFKSSKSFDSIQKLRFLDANGKEIESQVTGSSSMGIAAQMMHMRDYSLKEKPAGKVMVEVTYFQKSEQLQVPVDVEVGVGL